MNSIGLNGHFFLATESVLPLHNRSFKFGDGVFETMRMCNGTMPLAQWHGERVLNSLKILKMQAPDNHVWEIWLNEATELATKNGCTKAGRIRLTVYRENVGLGYSIEAVPLDESYLRWNEKGMATSIYPLARKTVDAFSNIKSTSYLPYVMAGLYADENGLGDCFLLNGKDAICDSSKANVFLVKDGVIYTPSLNQGCVQGVMRRKLIEEIKARNGVVQECTVTEEDLWNADEIFLTNALYGIRWVGSFHTKEYQNRMSKTLYHSIVLPLFS